MMNIKERHFWYIGLILILVVPFLYNSAAATSAPIIFGDEGYYGSRGSWILENLEIPRYWHIYGENEMIQSFWLDVPFIIFMVSSFFAVGGEFMVKMLDPILGVLTGIMTLLIARKLYSGKTGVLSMFFFVILPSVITYSVFLYGDMLLTLLMTSSIYFVIRGVKENSCRLFVVSGIFAGLAALTKETGLVLFFIYLAIFLFYRKDWVKRFGVLILIVMAFVAPWYGLHHYMVLGNPGIPIIENQFPSSWISPEIPDMEINELERHGSGTYASLVEYGVLNYITFSYGLGAFIFIVIGFSSLFYIKKKRNRMILLISFILLLTIGIYTRGESKVESISRWLIPLMPFFAIAAGYGIEKIYGFIKSYGNTLSKGVAILFVFAIILFGFTTASAKAQSLGQIKQWSPAFIEGCEWVRRNTPEDAKIATIWGHHTMYQCKRDAYWGNKLPNRDAIVLFANDTSYELLKDAGMDYLYIQKFSISFREGWETYPTEFVSYVKNSDKFKEAYDYPNNCLYSGQQDCVILYEII